MVLRQLENASLERSLTSRRAMRICSNPQPSLQVSSAELDGCLQYDLLCVVALDTMHRSLVLPAAVEIAMTHLHRGVTHLSSIPKPVPLSLA